MSFQTVNPATGEVLASYDHPADKELELSLDRAHLAWKNWRTLSVKERVGFFQKLALEFENRIEDMGLMATREMGKPLKEARAEVAKCKVLIDHYCVRAEEYLAGHDIAADGKKHRVEYESVGVLLSIMPWNFPYWQIMRFTVPNLLAGNTTLVKPAFETPGCAYLIEEAFKSAGFPEGVFQVTLASHDQCASLMADKRIRGVSFTGSCQGGKAVAAVAGANMKKVVMELGGSDPFVVMPDCDMEKTVSGAKLGRFLNCGQTCIAAKRFLVFDEVYEEFKKEYSRKLASLKSGDPLDPETTLGPLYNQKGFDLLKGQVKKALDQGATLAFGTHPDEWKSPWASACLLEGVTKNMDIYRQEVFGPVAVLYKVSSVEEAIELANDTDFGLGASVWGTDQKAMSRVGESIETGSVFYNCIVKSDPAIPFGGVKDSGTGRELGRPGITEFVNLKTYNYY